MPSGITVVDNTAFLVIDSSISKTKEGIRRGLLEVGPEIVREVVRLIKEPPKTGRYYQIGGRLHQASAPGESPANLTGALADSIGSEVSSPTQLIIGNAVPYGKRLEEDMDRPHLRYAALSKNREVEQAILQGTKRELEKR